MKQTHLVQNRVCNICGDKFVTEYSLKCHKDLSHKDVGSQLSSDTTRMNSNVATCSDVQEEDNNQQSSQEPNNEKFGSQRSTKRPTNNCSYCGKVFSSPLELEKHVTKHVE